MYYITKVFVSQQQFFSSFLLEGILTKKRILQLYFFIEKNLPFDILAIISSWIRVHKPNGNSISQETPLYIHLYLQAQCQKQTHAGTILLLISKIYERFPKKLNPLLCRKKTHSWKIKLNQIDLIQSIKPRNWPIKICQESLRYWRNN